MFLNDCSRNKKNFPSRDSRKNLVYKIGSCSLQEFHSSRYQHQVNFWDRFLRGRRGKIITKNWQKPRHIGWFGISVRNLQDWKLSIARISFTEISSKFCLPVSQETRSSETMEAKKMIKNKKFKIISDFKVRNLHNWKLSITRISFTGI